ncbi:hypothetical protein PPL_12275 [Heterostelium album PN500]|uniref:Uncharacterized protein n=1 Tax=Heterostelium pallidum (strain ATCC 26659 / Pp 5 / PN500) TaxID=670386 RepID=D3BM66_HETP5|nr:hypothetical protein PPL_12275 [Heterostelium album PN500]EFA77667.1 hypothetical protein PPL_12275 [Heterostelium album PN500]|eukprot:XP_020429795.1 hypothetical protein PPL_12275 [Heterostelium album PN500]
MSKKPLEKQPLISKYNKHVRDIIIIYILTFMIILGSASCAMTIFLNLLPSVCTEQIATGKEFLPTKCTVINHYVVEQKHVDADTCLVLNHKIWWYPLLGQNAFYHNVVENGNYTNDSGSNVIPLLELLLSDTSGSIDNSSSSYSGTYSGFMSGSYSYSSESSASSSSSEGHPDSSSSTVSNITGINCFQGLFEVTYSIGNQTTMSTNISGTWNSEREWVKGYLNAFPISDHSKCFYQDGTELNANWFSAPKFTISSVVLISISFLFIVVSFALDVHFIRKHRLYVQKKKMIEQQQIQQQSHHSSYNVISSPIIV